jgi:hypothetical protein
MATATKNKPATFIARATDFRLVVEPADVVRNHRGQIVETIPGQAVEFKQNRFVAEPDDTVTIPTREGDKEVWVAEYLRGLPGFNIDFWEIGNAPGELRPTFAEQNAKIIRALASRDVEAIAAVVDEEKATHKREAVFMSAEAALAGLAGDHEEDVIPDESD